jgi:hypothetical protein
MNSVFGFRYAGYHHSLHSSPAWKIKNLTFIVVYKRMTKIRKLLQ